MTEEEIIQKKRATRSLVVLGNAVDLGTNIITNISGNDISNSINGNTITKDLIRSIISTKIHNRLMSKKNDK